jgi:hypothetical protein
MSANLIGIIVLVIAFVVSAVVCYRCIRDGKVGPQFGLKFRSDEESPRDSTEAQSCKCLLRGYYLCFAILILGAVAALCIPGEIALCVSVLVMLAASVALGIVQNRMERRCPEIARLISNPYF